MEKFRKLKLSTGILKAIEEAGFSEPSEIQEKTIPPILEGRDVIGSSATGSGKTLAYGAGIIERIKHGQGVQALILTPTRELTLQVAHNLKFFSHQFDFSVKEVYGGVAINPQIIAIKKADVIVGTPGRILDHLNRGTIDFKKLKILVLDEADRMLEMGFIYDVEKIINQCPRQRQTLLFSATISYDIERIAAKHLKNPVRIEVESYVDASKLHQIFYDVHPSMKFSLLVHLLKKEKSDLVMVFCNTRRNTDFVAKNLKKQGLYAVATHGGLSQSKRNNILKSFHSRDTLILVCTDVAARGLDIKNVSHVYNYDISATSNEYIHRIGRTARAGNEGIAISLVSMKDYENFRSVCEDDSLKIKKEPLPEIETIPVTSDRYSSNERGRSRQGGRRDFRPRERYGSNRSNNSESSSNFRGNRRPHREGVNRNDRGYGGREEGRSREEGRESRERFHSRKNSNRRTSNRRTNSFKSRGRY